MKFKISSQSVNAVNLMRQLSYSPIYNGSFVRRLTRQEYPHFHIYLIELPEVIEVSMHLDQKGACYGGQTAHSGEYDGELLEQEKNRIIQLLEN